MSFGEKTLFRTSCPKRKNGRFTYEPSVLHGTLTRATKAQRSNCPANDFLLFSFLSRKKRKRSASEKIKIRVIGHAVDEQLVVQMRLAAALRILRERCDRVPLKNALVQLDL